MNISGIEYSIATKSLDIYISGCLPPYCTGCHNLELIDFKKGIPWLHYVGKIRRYVYSYNNLIENIFLLGGSFNHQDDEQLEDFFNMFYIYTNIFKDKKIWLFAREELEEVKEIFKQNCNYIKCGAYLSELSCEDNIQFNVKLATSNQKIYVKDIDY